VFILLVCCPASPLSDFPTPHPSELQDFFLTPSLLSIIGSFLTFSVPKRGASSFLFPSHLSVCPFVFFWFERPHCCFNQSLSFKLALALVWIGYPSPFVVTFLFVSKIYARLFQTSLSCPYKTSPDLGNGGRQPPQVFSS